MSDADFQRKYGGFSRGSIGRWIAPVVAVGAFAAALVVSFVPATFAIESSSHTVECRPLMGGTQGATATGETATQYVAAQAYVESLGLTDAAGAESMLHDVLDGVRTRCVEERQGSMNSVTLLAAVGAGALALSFRGKRNEH